MNTKTLWKLGALLVLLFMATASILAQGTGKAVVYVDVTNGSDYFSGDNATNNPVGTGPKATIQAGLNLLADGGKMIVVAGNYFGWDNAGGDLIIDNTVASGRIVTGLTIELRQLLGTQAVTMTAGNFAFRINNATLTFTTTSGSESFVVAAGSLMLGYPSITSYVSLSTAANFSLFPTASPTNGIPTISLWNGSGFPNKAPVVGSHVSLYYSGTGTFNATGEASYGNYGAGTLTVNKTSGAMTFGTAMTFRGNDANVITISGGDATFSGAVTIGAVGTSSTTIFSGDINVSGTSNATFNGAVTLVNTSAAASNIYNMGSGIVNFNAAVQWNASYDLYADPGYLATSTAATSGSLVYNASSGSISFASTLTLNNSTTTGKNTSSAAAVPINVYFENRASGSVSIASPGFKETAFTDANSNVITYTPHVYNNGLGTFTLSGDVRGQLQNTGTASTIYLNAATTVRGAVTNYTGNTINLGGNTLSLNNASSSSTTAHFPTSAGTVSNGTVNIAANKHSFTNGGTLPVFTVTSGTATFSAATTTSNVTVSSGTTLNLNGATTISGTLSISGAVNVGANSTVSSASTVSGGTLAIANGIQFTTTDFTESSGAVSYGGLGIATGAVSVPIATAGSGYTAQPSVSFSNQALGATAPVTVVHLTPVAVASVTVGSGGSYTSRPTVAFALPTLPTGATTLYAGVGAAATVNMTPTSISKVTISAGGAFYTTGATCTFSAPEAPGGITATGYPIVNAAGAITSVVITNAGSGYNFSLGVPTILFAGTGAGAAATVVPVATTVASVVVTNGGTTLYDVPPKITFSSGSASATAVLQPTSVASVDVCSGGNGFSAGLLPAATMSAYNATGGVTATLGAVVLGTASTGTMIVNGNLTRTGGAFNALVGSTLTFSGLTGQNVNGGQLFQTDVLNFTNTGGIVTLGESIRASKTVYIASGANVQLATYNVILNSNSAAGAYIQVSGQYQATGGGGVVVGGIYTVVGGTNANNAEIRGTSTGVYSNLIIDPGVGNTAKVTNPLGSLSDVKFNGTLTLRSGSLTIGDGVTPVDLGPIGTAAVVARDVTTPVVTLGSTGIVFNTGTFNAANVAYDLQYTGTLAADAGTGQELNANAKTWTINVNGDPTLVGYATKFVQLPATGTAGVVATFNGALTIKPLAGLRIATGGTGEKFILGGASMTHTIQGILTTVDANDYIAFQGDNTTIIGDTTTANAATIGNVQFGLFGVPKSFAISQIHNFSGNFQALGNSTVTLNMGSATTNAATLAGQQVVGGAGNTMSLAGTKFTLGSNIYVTGTGGVSFSSGTIDFSKYNLQMKGGNFIQTVSGTNYLTSGGYLEMNSAGSTLSLQIAATDALPNLRILANTFLGANSLVSGNLVIGSSLVPLPTLTVTTNNLSFSGSSIVITDNTGGAGTGNAIVATGSTIGGVGGNLNITSTAATITASGNYGIENLTFAPTGNAGTLTFATDDTTLTTSRVFIVNNILTHTAGVLALGINDLKLTGTGSTAGVYAYNRTVANGGTITTAGGYLEFGGSGATQYFAGGTGFSVPNIRINNTSGVANTVLTSAFTVTSGLDLTLGTLTTNAGTMTLADGVSVTRRDNTALLSSTPTLAGKISLSYVIPSTAAADVLTNLEMPSGATALNNLTINHKATPLVPLLSALPNYATPPGSGNGHITLTKNITVNGTLKLVAGALDNSGFGVNITSGGALEMNGGGIVTAPTALAYALIYSAGGGATSVTSTSLEFPDATVATITSLTIKNKTKINPTTLKLHATRSVGALVLNSSDGTNGGLDLNGKTLTATGDVTYTLGTVQNSSTTVQSTLVLGGAVMQTITVPSTGLTLPTGVDLRLNNAAGFTLTGGNLNMSFGGFPARSIGNTIWFVNGILSTGANSVVLAQTTAGQGFDRSGVAGSNISHIFGKVRHAIPGGAGNSGTYANGRFEFPVGTATKYRPMAVTFSNAYPAINPTNIDVSQVDSSAGGRVGLPLDGGGVRIGNYPKFYWLVTTTPSSFSASQQFDIELTGTNLGYPFSSAADLRIVRRQDGNADINPWQLQGTGASYQANYINVSTTGDSTIYVRSSSSLGGLVNQGSRFSIGIPTRPPVFTSAPTTGTVDENTTLTQQFTGDPQDQGETIAYSLVNPPAGAAVNASTGVFTWKPTYSQAGVYNVVVSITDGQFTVTTTDTVTVVNFNRAPAFSPRTATATVKDSDTLKVALAAPDADSDPVTYSFISVSPATTNAPAVAGLQLAWKPTFADAGKTYAILVLASDGVTTGHGPTPGTDTLTVSVTVNRSRARGDVDGNGTIQAADATLVLRHAAGLALITDPAALFAADASNNGTITSYDAALILQAAAGLITLPASYEGLSKTAVVAATGSLNWASPQATADVQVVKVGLKLTDAANVYSVQSTSKADFNLISVDGVNATLPEGWQMQWNVVGNELRIAMAGTTPLSSGDVATIMVRLKDKESRLNFSTDALLNENFQSLGAVEIAAVPTVFALEQNYPNPFNPSTTIRYQIPNDANVNLIIYNVQGQKIRTLVAKEQKAGYYNVVWDGRNEAGQTVSSGLYLYRVQAGSFIATQKMLMIK